MAAQNLTVTLDSVQYELADDGDPQNGRYGHWNQVVRLTGRGTTPEGATVYVRANVGESTQVVGSYGATCVVLTTRVYPSGWQAIIEGERWFNASRAGFDSFALGSKWLPIVAAGDTIAIRASVEARTSKAGRDYLQASRVTNLEVLAKAD
jgi:hypothetical protein